MRTYAGIDLHSTNNYIGVIDENDNRLYSKRHHNRIQDVVKALKKFKSTLLGVVVESTYNWYWIVDGLMENGFKVYLANPSAVKVYEGLKHTDDEWDSFWLAHLLRLGILPQGYIYPKEDRPIRDLLRRRQMFVKQRTTQIISVQSMITRNRGLNYPGSSIKQFRDELVEQLFDSPHLGFTGKMQLETIRHLSSQIQKIEDEVRSQVQVKPEFQNLLTIPGIGDILGLTITTETGDIGRFAKVGQFSSYCRCVTSKRYSNGKKKSDNNRKNGNKYLSWAFVEAANFTIRNCQKAQKFYQRKMAKTNRVVAIKALSNKLARAAYYIMRDRVSYDADRLFA